MLSWGGAWMAPGLKWTHTPYSKRDVSLKSAQRSTERKRAWWVGLKKGFFRPLAEGIPQKRFVSGTPHQI
jgi:hypothetical protein